MSLLLLLPYFKNEKTATQRLQATCLSHWQSWNLNTGIVVPRFELSITVLCHLYEHLFTPSSVSYLATATRSASHRSEPALHRRLQWGPHQSPMENTGGLLKKLQPLGNINFDQWGWDEWLNPKTEFIHLLRQSHGNRQPVTSSAGRVAR